MANPAKHFEKYRELIDDFEAFSKALGVESPDHVRVNPDRSTPEGVAKALLPLGLTVEPEPWFPGLLRVSGTGPKRLGVTLAHAMGHYYIQSASSALSALALAPRPGDQVLDMCAAPGSKTTLLAQLTGPQGAVVANEPSPKRMSSLVSNARRLGLTNIIFSSYMGQNFPTRHKFDRVLIDAPCSGEGTWRGKNARPRPMGDGQRESLAVRQSAILDRGVEALKPGGTLVYSTCTYAPEENELVVARAIERHGLIPLELEIDVPRFPGLTSWDGRELPATLSKAARLYPHTFDSEGFFVVRLVKPS